MNLLVSHAQQEFPKSMCANQGFAKGFLGGSQISAAQADVADVNSLFFFYFSPA